jgi:hypothetical protein
MRSRTIVAKRCGVIFQLLGKAVGQPREATKCEYSECRYEQSSNDRNN